MGKISEYNEGGMEGKISEYAEGEKPEKISKGKKVGISGRGGKETGKHRMHHQHQVKHDKMAHSSHHAKNKAHGTPGGFVTGEEYTGGAKGSGGGAPTMDSNCASCD